jgi:D-alanyl-D-alanine carboxypeptidase (penicillin-binding protein 5/6)
VSILVHKESASKATARIEYVGPLLAPIKQGDQAGALVVRMADAPDQKIPLFAAQDVDVGPLHRRAYDAALELLLGWTR